MTEPTDEMVEAAAEVLRSHWTEDGRSFSERVRAALSAALAIRDAPVADEELADARIRADCESERGYTVWWRMLARLDAAEKERDRLQHQLEIANRIISRSLPDLLRAARDDLAAIQEMRDE